jgi:thiol-disulfide isomerase/thioredoxin
MKFWIQLLLVLIIATKVTAQTDTIPTYLRNPTIPTFSIQLPDSSWFSKSQLSTKKPTLILYFSPDCGHCQLETEDIISKMNDLKKIQIVMVTSRPFEDMTQFAAHYKLDHFPNIKIGRDAQKRITQFYQVKFTPFSALYDKKGQLLKVYEKGIDWPELIGMVK